MTTTTTTRGYAATVAGVNRNQKNTGWAIQLKARQNMKFPDTFYVHDREAIAERVGGLKAGDYVTLELMQGNLKEGKTGEYGAWDYWENIVDFTVSNQPAASAPSSPQGDSVGTGPWDYLPHTERPLDQRIAWNSAINNATNLLAGRWAGVGAGWDARLIREDILYWATWYYQAITAGPSVQDVPAEAPTTKPSDAEVLGFDQTEKPFVAPPRHKQTGWPIIVEEACKGWNNDPANKGKPVTRRAVGFYCWDTFITKVEDLDIDNATLLAAAIAKGDVAGYA